MKNKLVRILPNTQMIWEALQSGKSRQRIYPADEAAMQAISSVLGERIQNGKTLHTLTVMQIMNLGFSMKTAKNAIAKLKAAKVIRLQIAHKFDAATGTTFAGLYEVNPAYIYEVAPGNLDELWMLWRVYGGSFGEYQAVRSQLAKEFGRVTVKMLSERLNDLSDRTEARITKAKKYHRSSFTNDLGYMK